MDKLQPIIRNKFWIFAFIAILAPIYPWMTTVNEMKAAYSSGESSIKQSFSSVPTNSNPENDNWIAPVKEATAQQEGRYVETQKMLWKMEKPLFVWPEEIQNEIVSNKIPFWGELPTSVLRTYKKRYPGYKYHLWKNTLHAFTPKAAGPITPAGAAPAAKPEADKTKPGEDIVAFPFTDLPLPDLEGSQVDLSSKDVWEAQEDIWLLESLFNAIAKVNRQQPIPAVSQMNAVIKQIYKVELMGGAKSRLNPGSPGSSIAGPPFTFSDSNAGAGVYTGVNNPSGAQLMPQNDIVSFSFSPSEEFGAGMVSRAPTVNHMGGGVAVIPRTPPKTNTPAPPAVAVGGKVVPDPKRYVDQQTAELNLRTRGFYIELLMDNDQIPQLLTEMRNSPWPTRIYRVQMAAKDNATAPAVNYATPAGAPVAAAVDRGGGGFGGFGGGRRRREDDDIPAAPQVQKPVVEAGPLASPKLAYVAIAGLITIYLPPTDADAQAAFLPAGSPPETSPKPGEKPVTTAQAPKSEIPPTTVTAAVPSEKPAETPGETTGTSPATPGEGAISSEGATSGEEETPANPVPPTPSAEQPPATPPPGDS